MSRLLHSVTSTTTQTKAAKPCPICQSEDIYQYKGDIQYSGVGEELLPKLGEGKFGVAKIIRLVPLFVVHVEMYGLLYRVKQ